MSTHERSAVGRALNDERLRRGWRWLDVSRRAGCSPETLRRLRQLGLASGADPLTIRRVENAMGWPPGTIDAIEREGTLPDWVRAESQKTTDASRDATRYLDDTADRCVNIGPGPYGHLVLRVIRAVEPDLAAATRGLNAEDERDLLDRIQETLIRQTRLFLELEERRGKQI